MATLTERIEIMICSILLSTSSLFKWVYRDGIDEVLDQAPIIECQYCHVKYPKDTTYCETCAKPLDIVEAERMKEQQREETKAMMYEIPKQDKAKKSKKKWGEEYFSQKESGDLRLPFRKDKLTERGYPPGSIYINVRSKLSPGIVSRLSLIHI